MPARCKALSVANRGSSSMITGSPAVTVKLWIRAMGVRPCSFNAFSETISTADAPSQIWLDDAAVRLPPSWSNFTPAMPSSVASMRMPSSMLCLIMPSGVSTSSTMISLVNAPELVAVLAFWWLLSANASSASLVKPCFLKIISAPMN